MSLESSSRNDIWKWLSLLIIAVFSIYVTYPPLARKDDQGKIVQDGYHATIFIGKRAE